jgi:hypothetical protein
MLRQSFSTSPQCPRWFSTRASSMEDPGSDLRKCIAREFLSRGTPLAQVRTVILSKDHTAAYLEFTARPLDQNDNRLKHKPWGQLFIEQTFDDTARVIRAIWACTPILDSITLKVFRCPSPQEKTKPEAILLVRARGTVLKDKVLHSNRTFLPAILQHCRIHCEPDPRLGLRALKEE